MPVLFAYAEINYRNGGLIPKMEQDTPSDSI